jgi:flagellar protein FliO/FliZ
LSDGIALVRALGALLTVLGILAGALWAVRRFNIVLPGSGAPRPERRLAVIERLSLDPRRSITLLRRDGVEHLLLIAPEGHLLIESGIPTMAFPASALPQPVQASAAHNRAEDFTALVERAGSAPALPVDHVAAWHDHHG